MTQGLSSEVLLDQKYDKARKQTYLALDFASWAEAQTIVDMFGQAVDGYKVGLELFHAEGPQVVRDLVEAGKRVFLDVKLHDIPNTVAGALRAISGLGVEMVNVHAVGGRKMMEVARAEVDRGVHRPLLIAVTVLTSMDQVQWSEVSQWNAPSDAVSRLADLAAECGLDGVVASAQELKELRKRTPTGFELVVPGTRPAGADLHDQVRTLSPGEAIAAGASRLVVGRTVIQSHDKVLALRQIWDDMSVASKCM